jgi:GcrA cell cycle regulator
MSWTDERVTQLKRLWNEGRTAAEIADELGGITRNAVIGKAHRLNLSNRVSPLQQDNKAPSGKKTGTAPIAAMREKAAPLTAPIARSAAKTAVKGGQAACKKSGGVKMTDLKDRMCRWPFGDPRDADFHFCGDTNVPGLPYCPDHAKMAYQAARARTLQAEDFEDRGHHNADGDHDKEAVA